MKIILTGAGGNLGSHILTDSKFETFPISRNDWDSVTEIAPNEYQALIHCAYDLKEDINEQPASVLDSNIISTGKALKLCKDKQVPKFVFISSCSVYGDSSNSAEDKQCCPVNMNGFIKLFNEELIKSFCEANSIEYLILRVFNTYGGKDTFSVVYKLVSAAKQNQPFTLVNEGNSERDFIHVGDVAKIVCALTEKNISNETVNIGSGKSVRIIDLVNRIEEVYGDIPIVNKYKENEAVYSRANIKKLNQLISFKPLNIFDFISAKR